MKKLRLTVQLIYTALTNGYVYGFLQGKIYQGKLKYACVPGLNCYSCPGAVGSCPIGALQALLNQRGFALPFAALGVFFVFGSLLGRFVCGWLCPFGLVQDLLHRLPVPHKRKRLPGHRVLKYGKYLTLAGLVCAGSLLLIDGLAKVPAFCKYLCPSGTLFGALPLLGSNESLRAQAGGLFGWKLAVLALIVLLSVKVYRPFCQYLCPLGAIYGWFNRFSLVQLRWEKDRCTGCGACRCACPVDLPPQEISRSAECIRCGACAAACPEGCVAFGTAMQAAGRAPQGAGAQPGKTDFFAVLGAVHSWVAALPAQYGSWLKLEIAEDAAALYHVFFKTRRCLAELTVTQTGCAPYRFVAFEVLSLREAAQARPVYAYYDSEADSLPDILAQLQKGLAAAL